MKKHKFKLEALLKMRQLKEEESKMRIGKLQLKKRELESQMAQENSGISQAYESQEASVNQGATGLDLRFYPYFMQGKRASVAKIKSEIEQIDQMLGALYWELSELRAKTKVLEEMKGKDKKAHKKLTNKKMSANIEEQVQNWTQYKKGS